MNLQNEVNSPGAAKYANICCYANTVIIVLWVFYFLLIPLWRILSDLSDPALNGLGIPSIAYRMHRKLSPDYALWARQRISAGTAESLTIDQIAETEWPVFGSAFYLWATEQLQSNWENDPECSPAAPAVYAREAIEAAAALIADPGHAAWVRQHWGDDYLTRQNLFYRSLLIAGLTSYQKLTGSDKYSQILRRQTETLSAEIDNSPFGLLDDYPAQCYPTDIVTAIAAIKNADEVLGTDHSDFVKRSIRGFQGQLLDSTGLPPFGADSKRGTTIGRAAGCGCSFLLSWAPQLWPDTSKQWYDNYEEHFWQSRYGFIGFREYPKDFTIHDWGVGVDAGPVVAGFGTSASSFGVGAARANGRFDHAWPLAAELITLSGMCLDGDLYLPQLLSNPHAPYLGHAGVLFSLTRTPAPGVDIVKGGRLPLVVYLIFALYLGLAILFVLAAYLRLSRWLKRFRRSYVLFEKTQFVIWLLVICTGILFVIAGCVAAGAIILLLAQFFPRFVKKISVQSQ